LARRQKVNRKNGPGDRDISNSRNGKAPAAASLSDLILVRGPVLLFAAAFLCFLWSLNYNRLGSFYDYSIIVDGAGKFEAGLRPFRDFVSPLQTLTFWAAWGSELVFGHRYLALCYGNLALTLALFGVIVFYASRAFSFLIAVLIGLAVAAASTLQHGILWYNSLGLLLLVAISLKAAAIVRSRAIGVFDAGLLAALLILIGMVKVNFFAVGILIAAAFALAGLWDGRLSAGLKTAVALARAGAAICCAPPLIEAFANHVSISTWIDQVVRMPGGRLEELQRFFSPHFYLGMVNDFYFGSVLQGCVLICLIGYAFLGWAAWRESRAHGKFGFRRFIPLTLLAVLWFCTTMLTATNVEILSLCLCFCLPGLAALKLSGFFEEEYWSRPFSVVAAALSVYFLIVGGIALSRNARIMYEQTPFVAQTVPNDGPYAYLGGVQLTEAAAGRIASIESVLRQNPGAPVYWGPGLELMNRIHPGVVAPAFPLWYHMGITVKESSAPRLIEAIERSGARLIIGDRFWVENFPKGVREYLNSWERQEPYGIVVWRKRS
jgi:hypothetical protein